MCAQFIFCKFCTLNEIEWSIIDNDPWKWMIWLFKLKWFSYYVNFLLFWSIKEIIQLLKSLSIRIFFKGRPNYILHVFCRPWHISTEMLYSNFPDFVNPFIIFKSENCILPFFKQDAIFFFTGAKLESLVYDTNVLFKQKIFVRFKSSTFPTLRTILTRTL